jgi:short-subunit dehydrogenase
MTAKTVLITGASSGIGAAVARELIARNEGHRLAITARRAGSLEALASLGNRQEILVIPADLAKPESAREIVDATLRRFGRLDVLINNAGLGLPEPFALADPEELARQIQINFTAPLILTRWAIDALIASRGTVINIGSSITVAANPIFGAYGATKAGLAYWNNALRRELRSKGVQVCLVEPGPVATEFFDAVASRFPGHEARGGNHTTEDLRSADRFKQFAAVNPPPDWTSARVDDVAKRVVRLIDHPQRRLSVLRRIVWPFRVIGQVFQAFPLLGDLAIGRMVSRMEAHDEGHAG